MSHNHDHVVDFDKFTDNYNALLHQQTNFFASSEAYFAQYKVDIVCEQVGSPVARILEYGCGIGRNISFLQKAFPGAEIVGTDISAASIDMAAKENPGVKFYVEGDAAAPALGQFDLIFIAGVFHHIPPSERLGAAKNVLARLAPGGEVFIFEHNPYNPVTRHLVNTCPYDEGVVLLTPPQLRALLTQAGFAVQKRSYCLFIPARLKKLVALERWLQWLPMGGQYWTKSVAALANQPLQVAA